LRIVVIAGRCRHALARLSSTPLTNLNLRNERMAIATLRQHLPAACWLALRTCCEQAMGRVFPNSLYAGLDVLVGSNLKHHAIAEVNAFGDHLNDTLWNGLTTH